MKYRYWLEVGRSPLCLRMQFGERQSFYELPVKPFAQWRYVMVSCRLAEAPVSGVFESADFLFPEQAWDELQKRGWATSG
jgi:hypothetical protein